MSSFLTRSSRTKVIDMKNSTDAIRRVRAMVVSLIDAMTTCVASVGLAAFASVVGDPRTNQGTRVQPSG